MFTKNATSTMQMLGIQAAALLRWNGANIVTITSYHCTVAYAATGKFHVTFTLPGLPSANYQVLGGGFAMDPTETDTTLFFIVNSRIIGDPSEKTNLGFKFKTIYETAAGVRGPAIPEEVWFICFGG
jgi:hypothetical protein